MSSLDFFNIKHFYKLKQLLSSKYECSYTSKVYTAKLSYKLLDSILL